MDQYRILQSDLVSAEKLINSDNGSMKPVITAAIVMLQVKKYTGSGN